MNQAIQDQTLASVSSLKRTLGIPNHPTQKDRLVINHCHIYTADKESAEVISELLYRWATGRKKARDDLTSATTIRDTVRLKELDTGGFEVSISLIDPDHFGRGIKGIIDAHIAPDASRGRS